MSFWKRNFTFIMVPHHSSRMLKVSISHWLFFLCLAVGTSFFGYLGFNLYQAKAMNSKLAKLEGIREEYLAQKTTVQKLSHDMGDFQQEIERLREFDYKLRNLADLKTDYPLSVFYGLGGSGSTEGGSLSLQADLSQMNLAAIMSQDLEQLKELSSYQEESFNNLKSFIMEEQDLLRRSPYRWPLRGFVTSGFGPRKDPFTGLKRLHEGLDIAAPRGSEIYSPADGIVTFVTSDPVLGKMLVVDHGYGTITRYGHLDSFVARTGQKIRRGEPLAKVGSSGRSTGPHLHYEIRLGDVAINPLNYIID